jgi:hypothetical protein
MQRVLGGRSRWDERNLVGAIAASGASSSSQRQREHMPAVVDEGRSVLMRAGNMQGNWQGNRGNAAKASTANAA